MDILTKDVIIGDIKTTALRLAKVEHLSPIFKFFIGEIEVNEKYKIGKYVYRTGKVVAQIAVFYTKPAPPPRTDDLDALLEFLDDKKNKYRQQGGRCGRQE